MSKKYWDAEVSNSKILKSKIDGEAIIVDSFIQHSEILHAEIYKSRVMKSQVADARIYNAEIFHSTLIGKRVKVLGREGMRPLLKNCLLTDNAFVSGQVTLEGVTVGRMMRVEYGRWNRQPRYFETENSNGDIFGITEQYCGMAVHFGCREYLMKDLIRHKDYFRKVMHLPLSEINRIEKTFIVWLNNRIPTFQLATTAGAK